MGLEDLKPEGLGGPVAGSYAFESMAEVATAARAVVLGRPQVQGNELVTLSRVLQDSLIGGLDPNPRILAVKTARSLLGLGVHSDRIIAINAFDLQFRKA
jgi:hypothetical protein